MSPADRVVRVAVDALADRPERTFSYRVPADVDVPAPGSLVLVPYGRRVALGYVMEGEAGPAEADLKEIEAVVSRPMLTPDLLVLAEAIAAYYRAPVGTTLAAMLPPGLESRLSRTWEVLDPGALPPGLAGAAVAGETAVAMRPSCARHPDEDAMPGWSACAARARSDRIGSSDRPRHHRGASASLRPLAGDAEPPRRAPVQRALLDALGTEERTMAELADLLGTDASSLLGPARRLVALGRAEMDWRIVERSPLAHRAEQPDLRGNLAAEQRTAVDAIGALRPGGELLLQGVAASGKTDVYLAAAVETIAAGRSVDHRGSGDEPRPPDRRSTAGHDR